MQTMSDPIATVLGSWSSQLTIPSIALRMALSFLFAAVIGCERSNKRHSAGLRTFILVALSSTAATLLDLFLMEISKFGFAIISAAVVIGIAIISTSSILYSSKSQIKGLTTACRTLELQHHWTGIWRWLLYRVPDRFCRPAVCHFSAAFNGKVS